MKIEVQVDSAKLERHDHWGQEPVELLFLLLVPGLAPSLNKYILFTAVSDT